MSWQLVSYFLETQALYQTLHVALNYNDYISKKPVQVSRVLKLVTLVILSLSLHSMQQTLVSIIMCQALCWPLA